MNPRSLKPIEGSSSPPLEFSLSDFSTDSISSMLALLQQLSGWFHSDATQNPLIVFFVISSCFLCKSETPSLTSTPTHLQDGKQLQLFWISFSGTSSIWAPSPPWLFGQIAANNSSALIWLWLHFEAKPAVHQLWLWLISALKPKTYTCSISSPKAQW